MTNSDFIVFIISHGRYDNIRTYDTLRRRGYTGPVKIVIDNLDKTQQQYLDKFGDEVVVFDKPAIAATVDCGDNFQNLRSTTHARNACFNIARDLGVTYFLVLDDDYTGFQYRFDEKFNYQTAYVSKLDEIFDCVLDFYKTIPCLSIAMAQGGDFIGGAEGSNAEAVRLSRKCMNSFFCSTERPFNFFSRLNEDVNTYITLGSVGGLFFTFNQVSLVQLQTQVNAGGMSEAYLDSGTYVKSFYSVMYMPSAAKVDVLRGGASSRIHHRIAWGNTVPKILSENHRLP